MMFKRGQSAVEYAWFITLVIAVFLAMSFYMKRGLSGRIKSHADDLGDQFDPTVMISSVRTGLRANSTTKIKIQFSNAIVNGVQGYWTDRVDATTSTETKTGSSAVGAY